MAPRPQTWGKLTAMRLSLSVKQNSSPAWLLGPQTWGKLTTKLFSLSVKQNSSPAWLLGPQTWGKLISQLFALRVKQNPSPGWLLGPQTWGKLALQLFCLIIDYHFFTYSFAYAWFSTVKYPFMTKTEEKVKQRDKENNSSH